MREDVASQHYTLQHCTSERQVCAAVPQGAQSYLLKVTVAELELSTDLLASRLLISSHPPHDREHRSIYLLLSI